MTGYGHRWAPRGSARGRGAHIGHAVVVVLIAMISTGCTSPSPTSSDGAADSATVAVSPSPSSTLAGLVPTAVRLDGTEVDMIPGLPADAWNLALSPDGNRIAYVTRAKDAGNCGGCITDAARVVVVEINGTMSHYVTLARGGDIGTLASPRHVHSPAWSPDGTELAFVGTKRGNEDIYVVSANSQGKAITRRLTRDPAQDEFPTWSPDGLTIAYDDCGSTPCDNSGLSPTQEIWTIPSHGGTPLRLTNNDVADQAPSYAPDGTMIAFFHDGAIFMTGAQGGPVRSVLKGGVVEGWSPTWSPKGDKIAYLVFGGDRAMIEQTQTGRVLSLPLGDVKVVDLSSGVVTSVDAATASSYNPVSWMPSGQAVLVDRYPHT
jgi:Tol biopolymer transport system component